MKARLSPVAETPALGWLSLALVVLLLPHLANQPAWIVGLALLGVVWRYAGAIGRMPLPGRWLLILMAVLATLGVIATHGTLLGRDAGVSLLLIMTGMKMLETRSHRDTMMTVFLGYFVVITHFFYSQELPVVLYLLTAMLVTTMALIRINASGEPPALREQLGLAGLMLLQALPVMVILFLLFPRLPGPLWAMPQPDYSRASTGLSNSMSPGSISELLQSNAIAFRASFSDAPPSAPQRYWRGPVFNLYDGRTWRAGHTPMDIPEPLPPSTDEALEYSIMLEPHGQRWLLALDRPVDTPSGTSLNADYVLTTHRPVQRVESFALSADTGAPLETTLTDSRRQQGLQLPSRSAPRARALAQEWVEHSSDPEDVIRQALTHFNREAFHYTLTPPLLTGDAVDQFLFESRAGFCEHYASSFVFLMRAAGIPARVVTGYQGGEWNRAGGYLVVRQSDAHAWAEVWLEGRGWVRVDPTGAVAPERIELGIRGALGNEDDLPDFLRDRRGLGLMGLRIQLEYWREMADYYWNGWVLAFGPERQKELLQRLGLGWLDWRGVTALMVALLMLTAGLLALVFLWRNRRPQRDPLARIYRRFTRRMARLGIPPRSYEGPRDYARRVARERPQLQGAVEAFTRTYEALRYGPEPDPDQFRTLQTRLKALPSRA
ncbi:MAG: DUF3488 and DUF4129 domain-containing transglutaminase family protein [Thioalkalivibrio sp.]